MKFPKNSKKRSFTLLTLLSSGAIAISLEVLPIKSSSKNQSLVPAVEQQLKNQKSQNPIDRINSNNDKVLEEIELDKEWEGIFDDKSKEEILLAVGDGM
ncbi:hypothetical protein IQ238_20120 [Pleurocapsales cyanobacterium LEGE 06147]|nr:hypothetical protein [Pleurocapsales cyanobacterium LEGE 06147]